MKLKIVIIIFGAVVIVSSIIIAVKSRAHAEERRRLQQIEDSQNRVGVAMSNYTHTFKLNTNPPIWPAPQKK